MLEFRSLGPIKGFRMSMTHIMLSNWYFHFSETKSLMFSAVHRPYV